MFAFSPVTDPIEVLIELAWAWPAGQTICSFRGESHPDTYCVECHAVAWAAREQARERLGDE